MDLNKPINNNYKYDGKNNYEPTAPPASGSFLLFASVFARRLSRAFSFSLLSFSFLPGYDYLSTLALLYLHNLWGHRRRSLNPA